MKKLFQILLILGLASWANATVYYVDNCDVTGNDSNNGTSTATPWLTINKVNTSSFSGDDQILFRKGCTWREQLTVPSSGTSGHPITIGAYGSGAAPRIFASDQVSAWTPYVIPAETGNTTNEGFNAHKPTGSGYDTATWTEIVSGASSIDPDDTTAGILGGCTDCGTEQLKLVKAASSNSASKYDVGSVKAITYSEVNFYLTAGLTNNQVNVVFKARESTADTWSVKVKYTDAAGYQFDFYTYTNGAWAYRASSATGKATNTWYKLQVKYDYTNKANADAVQFKLDGVEVYKADLNTGTIHTGVQYWYLGDAEGNAGAWTTYYDRFQVDTAKYLANTISPTNIWKATFATTAGNLWFVAEDGTITWGDAKATAYTNLVNEYDWVQLSGVMYVYAASDPDDRYASVEAAVRDYGIYATGKAYVTIDGLEVAYTTDSGHGIFLTAASDNVVIQNCTVHHVGIKGTNQNACGIMLARSSNGLIAYNTVHNAGRRGISLITTSGTGSNNIIEHNTVYDCYHSGIEIANTAGTVADNIVRYNYVYNTAGFDAATYTMQGIYLDGLVDYVTHGTQIYYNKTYNLSGKHIEVGTYCTDTVIYNNTMYLTHTSAVANAGIGIKLSSTGSSGHIVKNNIGWTRDVCFYVVDKTLATADNNLWYNSAGTVYADVDGSAYHSDDQAAYIAASGFDTNGKWADPLLVSTSDFHLQAGSPAINAGTYVGLVSDYDGNPVPAGGLVDIGAYEKGPYDIPLCSGGFSSGGFIR